MKYIWDNNPKLKKQDANTFSDYKKEGIIEKTTEICESDISHYLSHRPVMKENQATLKVREAFHGFTKYKDQPSANQLLLGRSSRRRCSVKKNA